MKSPDLSTFTSRLYFYGQLGFSTGLHIGATRASDVAGADLPILRDTLGKPYIPGSSFKGALRSYVESVLRTLQDRTDLRDRNLACLSVGKPDDRPQDEAQQHICLTQQEVSILKAIAPGDWAASPRLPAALKRRLPDVEKVKVLIQNNSREAIVDDTLRDLSCWTCRVFGAPWLAAKALVRDLMSSEELAWPVELRTGVAIDRDAGRAYPGQLYDLEVLPAGVTFDLHILVENASPAELGLLWLGISAFERGEVPLGGARSRGLGWCSLSPNWERSRYIEQDNLIDFLFSPEDKLKKADLAIMPAHWVRAFGQTIGAIPAEGGQHA